MNNKSMKKYVLFLLPAVLCVILTACQTKEEPPEDKQTPPVLLTPYDFSATGTTDLTCDAQWEVSLEAGPPASTGGDSSEVGKLVCRNLQTGEAQILDELFYGPGHSYWHSVQLYPFTGILGSSGFIFDHAEGAAFEALDIYAVSETGPVCIARCNNSLYTADLDRDGSLELLSNYHLMGYLDLFWLGEDGAVRTASLNEAARDLLELDTELISLYIDAETSLLSAKSIDGAVENSIIDPAELFAFVKMRTDAAV